MSKQAFKIDAILLAAGSSSRFGSDKRLYEINGRPMLQQAISAIVDAVNSVIVVMKQNDCDALPRLLGGFLADCRIRPLLLEYPEAGIGSNIAYATRTLSGNSDGVLVMLADMPYVQSQTAQAVVDNFDAGKIVVPVCVDSDGQEKQGHPVFFARQFFEELAALNGDTGARAVLRDNTQSITYVSVVDRGILQDIDIAVG